MRVVLFHHTAEVPTSGSARSHGVEGAEQQLVGLQLDDDAAAASTTSGWGDGQLFKAALLKACGNRLRP